MRDLLVCPERTYGCLPKNIYLYQEASVAKYMVTVFWVAYYFLFGDKKKKSEGKRVNIILINHNNVNIPVRRYTSYTHGNHASVVDLGSERIYSWICSATQR